jgi:hypothetical protein
MVLARFAVPDAEQAMLRQRGDAIGARCRLDHIEDAGDLAGC